MGQPLLLSGDAAEIAFGPESKREGAIDPDEWDFYKVVYYYEKRIVCLDLTV
jgi:hypothetical protein